MVSTRLSIRQAYGPALPHLCIGRFRFRVGIVRDGDGMDLLEWLDDPVPRIRMRTPEGDELERVQSTWVVPDDVAARDRLARSPDVHADRPDRYAEMLHAGEKP